jgi:hypothetical protein
VNHIAGAQFMNNVINGIAGVPLYNIGNIVIFLHPWQQPPIRRTFPEFQAFNSWHKIVKNSLFQDNGNFMGIFPVLSRMNPHLFEKTNKAEF